MAKQAAKSKAKATKATLKKKSVAKQPDAPALDTSWHDRFLQLLRHSCSVTTAALGAGVNRTTVYRHRDTLPDFAAAWNDEKEAAIEILEAEAWNRARKKSDVLIMFLLKANRPEKYRERYDVNQTSVNINWDELTEHELQRIAAGEAPAIVLADRSKQTA